jgi:serine/threonine-protein kinase
MLFQMLTGVLPFRGDSMAELMFKIANEPAPDIRIVRSDISDRLAAVVAKALAKKPEERYQDGDAFAGDLKAVIAEMSGSPVATSAVAAQPAMQSTAPEAPEKTMAFAATGSAPAGEYERTVVGVPGGPLQESALTPDGGATNFEKTAVFPKPDSGNGTGA